MIRRWGHGARLRARHIAGAAMLGVCALLVGGCVNQRAEVQKYRDVVDRGVDRPTSYQQGQILSLERAIALANEDNEEIARQGENYVQAVIAKNRALAAFLPTVSFQPSFQVEQRGAGSGGTPGNATQAEVQSLLTRANGFVVRDDTLQSLQAPVVGSINVFNGFQDLNNVRSTEQQIEQQKQLLLDAQATVILNVAQAYYQVLRSEEQVEVLEAALNVQEERLRQVQGRFENHLALALEVSQQLAQVADTRATLTQAQNDVRNGRRTLAFLIGVPPAGLDGKLIDEVIVPNELPPIETFRQIARSTRQDLLAADANVRAAKFAVDSAIGEYYPSVGLNVQGFLYREYFSSASKWDAILVANLPIFSAGVIEANVRAAWSRLRQAALYQQELMRSIDRDTQNAYDNLITARRRLSDLRLEVQASADELQQSGQLLSNGLAVPLDVLTAQSTLLNSQLLYTSESFDRTVFYLDLLRVVGRLNPGTPLERRMAPVPTTEPATRRSVALGSGSGFGWN